MSFFGKLFTKKNYSNSLQFEDNECTHCHEIPTDKLKKCQECGSRNICKGCYKHKDLILCKTCDDNYNQWAKQLQKAKVVADKEDKYSKHGVAGYIDQLL